MQANDFTATILVDQAPQKAFTAINNVRGWWSENTEGSTDKLDSVFDYHYKDAHRCRIKIIELVPEQKVVWLVLENFFNFTKDKTEWNDTKIIFDITKKGQQTEVRFTHQGLVPHFECYEVCNNAWSHFIGESLRDLITTGQGQPTPFDEAD